MLLTNNRKRIGLSFLTSLVMLLMAASVAHASGEFLGIWGGIYPSSTSDNASCQLCHASSTQNLNPYGKAICDETGDITARIQAVENADSDADSTGSINITEINADTQPGWTITAVPTYARSNCVATGSTETAAQAGVSGLLDPVVTPTTTTTLAPTPTTTLAPTPTTTLVPASTTTTTLPSEDLCPDDPDKTEPGVCGCGRTDIDSDADGILDCLDNAPYDSNEDQLDTDGDGVGDAAETGAAITDPTVASLSVNYGQDRVTLSSAAGNSLENVSTLPTDQVADLPAGVTFPFDLFGFTITGVGAGNPTTVTITLPDGEAPTTYWKYGPTPDNNTDHWYEFLYDGTTGAELDANVITLHFVDGERGDHDLTADGIIDDPGGPAFVSTGGGGSSSACFIATAAYGTSWEPHVMTLRQFRDSYLLTNKLGTKFVQAYYRFSPPIAEHIAEHDNLRSVTRIGIAPLVGFSWLAIHYGMTTALLFLAGIITLCVGTTRLVLKTTRS